MALEVTSNSETTTTASVGTGASVAVIGVHGGDGLGRSRPRGIPEPLNDDHLAPERHGEEHAQRVRAPEERHRAAVSDRLDGISVSYPDYWFNVRPSNTEPILRVRLEARSHAIADKAAAELRALIGG